jgi:hypothetical protein
MCLNLYHCVLIYVHFAIIPFDYIPIYVKEKVCFNLLK